MRTCMVLIGLALLSGCAGPLPRPDPDMAWVELSAPPADLLMADRLDDVITPDGRYFQVPPGVHELEARYEFEISRGGFDDFGDTELRCTLVVRHDFQAGARYRLVARSLGYQPQGWLLDERGQEVAEARATHCH